MWSKYNIKPADGELLRLSVLFCSISAENFSSSVRLTVGFLDTFLTKAVLTRLLLSADGRLTRQRVSVGPRFSLFPVINVT